MTCGSLRWASQEAGVSHCRPRSPIRAPHHCGVFAMPTDPTFVFWDAIVLGLFVAAYIVFLFWAIAALSPKPELVRTAGWMLAVMWVGFWVWFIAGRPYDSIRASQEG
jgi:hypothetical protein